VSRWLAAALAVAAVLVPAAPAAREAALRHEVLGYSVEHRPIVAWLVGSPSAPRTMVVIGSIAGDESAGIAVARLLASRRPVHGVQMWLIPDVNPDGAARGTRENARGVDLNRNAPYHWRRSKPGTRYYSGRRPASEPETRAIERFLRAKRPKLSVWLHEPYGLVDDTEGPRWAERLVGHELGLPLRRLPRYPGSEIEWEDHLVHASAFDVELRGNGHLSRAATRRVAGCLRSLARRYASRG
jgi:protein MpaA